MPRLLDGAEHKDVGQVGARDRSDRLLVKPFAWAVERFQPFIWRGSDLTVLCHHRGLCIDVPLGFPGRVVFQESDRLGSDRLGQCLRLLGVC